MDFKKPNSQKLQDTAVLIGGSVAGGMLSRGLFGAIHEKKAVTEADIKSEKTMGYVKRGGLIVASLYAASGITGTDSTATAAKGALYGVVLTQALDFVKEISETSTAAMNAANGSTAKDKFVARALGLGCACDSAPALGRPRRRRRGMGNPMIELPAAQPLVDRPVNSLEASLMSGKQLAS